MCVTVDVCASALLVVCASQARSQALCWGGGGGGGVQSMAQWTQADSRVKREL